MIKMKKISVSIICIISLTHVLVFCETDDKLTIENVIIISNETDNSFCRDFSILLKRLHLEWVVVKSREIPELIRDRNIIILGGPDAEYIGDIVRDMTTWREEYDLRKEGHYSILKKDHPWAENRAIYLCAGSDRLLTKRAAEECISLILKEIHNPEEWIIPVFSRKSREEIREYVTQFQTVPHDDELPKDVLSIEINPDVPEHISLKEAQEDIEYLFYLLAHGYGGYGYFKAIGDFEKAKKNLLEELETHSTWSIFDFSYLIHEHLIFIHDGHFRVGYNRYFSHKSFWYDTTFELWKTSGEYSFFSDKACWRIMDVNGKSPQEFAFPSLNAQGIPIYRLGVISQSPPEPLIITAIDGDIQKQFEVQLFFSLFTPQEIFYEDIVDGIPVISIRSFEGRYENCVKDFFETAQKYRRESCIILDIRGNSGGNSSWAEEWIVLFTGRSPGEFLANTEFNSKTTMMGCVNYYRQNMAQSKIDAYTAQMQINRYENRADVFENQSTTPYWSPIEFPHTARIPNSTTIVVLTDNTTASTGEMFVGFLRQVENVIFVGENTTGASTFGNITLHQLPHSNLSVVLPTKLFIPSNLEILEEKGFFPDVWVPADDALSCVIEAIKNETFTAPPPEDSLEDVLQENPSSNCATTLLMGFIISMSILSKKRF
jgi:hypothetical protein